LGYSKTKKKRGVFQEKKIGEEAFRDTPKDGLEQKEKNKKPP
jgi:hypothetical protein